MEDNRKANVNVYLVLQTHEGLLLSLRENTGYEDGKWSLVAGHCEAFETAKEAMCREAQEEIGIVLSPHDLEVVHVMHRFTNRANVDIFMRASAWQGDIANCEPHKCGGVRFFSTLPDTTIPYIRQVINHIHAGRFYSEER